MYFQVLFCEMFYGNEIHFFSPREAIIFKIQFWQPLLTFRIFQNSLSFPPGPCVKRVTEVFSSLRISARPSLHHEDLQGCFLRWVPDGIYDVNCEGVMPEKLVNTVVITCPSSRDSFYILAVPYISANIQLQITHTSIQIYTITV